MQNTLKQRTQKYTRWLSVFLITALLLRLQPVPDANAATIIVNHTADNTNPIAGDGGCTLREAINNANSDKDTTSGDCTAGNGDDTITFKDNIAGSTITLGGTQLEINSNLTITGPMTISGNNSSRVFQIGSGNAVTLSSLTIQDGLLSYSGDDGGGIHSKGNLTVIDSTISNNTAYEGGGIYNDLGELTIIDSTIFKNTAGIDGGGIYTTGLITIDSRAIGKHSAFTENQAQSGGGIYIDADNEAIVITADSVISANYAGLDGGGLYIQNAGSVEISGYSNIENNDAGNNGGGIFVHNVGSLDIKSSEIASNVAGGDGGNGGGGGIAVDNTSSGDIHLDNATITDNFVHDGNGGGIFADQNGTWTIANSEISANTANSGGGVVNANTAMEITNTTIKENEATGTTLGSGGGILNTGEITMTGSTISANTSNKTGAGIYNNNMITIGTTTIAENEAINAGGGGIYNYEPGELIIHRSTIAGNIAAESNVGGITGGGGGIYNLGSTQLEIENSTISGNTSVGNGGGIFTLGLAGSGINLSNVTISANTTDGDGGGLYIAPSGNWNGNIKNSILAGNTGANNNDCSGTLTSGGYNLVQDPNGCNGLDTTGDDADITNVDPSLGNLANNGGPTQTHALPLYSPAINAGNPAGCKDKDGATLTTDQRGLDRDDPMDEEVCDIGAYEQQALPDIDVQRSVTGTSIPDGGTRDQGKDKAGRQNLLILTIENTGAASLVIHNITSANPNNVTVDEISLTSITLSGGAAQDIEINYTPGVTGADDPFRFELDIDNNDPGGADGEGNYDITVIGTADSTPPQPIISSSEPDPTNQDPFDVTIDFGEPVTGFFSGDISVTNGSVESLTNNGAGSYTASIDAASDGQIHIDIGASAALDWVGNASLAADTFSITVDTTAPTPVITGPSNPTRQDPFDVTIDFGETVTSFASSDIIVANGSVSGNLTDNGNGSYTASIDPASDGQVTIDIDAGAAQDDAGNDSVAADTFSIIVDTIAPAPTISGPSDPTGDDPFDVTIDFSEAVIGFEVSDIVVNNGSVSGSLTDNGDGSYIASIDADSDGQVTINVPAAAAQDMAGNESLAANTFSITVDTVPKPTISSTEPDPTNNNPFDVTIDFGESVTGFDSSEISVGNGSVDSLSDTGSGSYVATINATSDGQVTVDIPAGVAQDQNGNDNLAADRFSITVDTTGPKPTISSTEPDPTNNNPFDVTIDFGEPVTGFDSSEISVGNGSVDSLSDTGSGSYVATINATSDGQVTVDISAGVAQDQNGNDNLAADSFSLTVDTTGSKPTISSTEPDPTNNNPFDVIIDFGEPVTDFDSGDISVGNGSVDSLSDTGSGSYVATINATSDGQVTVDIPAAAAQDQLGNDSLAADTFSITVDSTITAPGEPDLAASSDTGSFDDDDVTDDDTPRFTGTCEQAATVTLTSSLDGDLTPTGICSGGTYDITITSALREGTHEITASQVDQAGNSSPESSALRIEIIIPTLTVNVVGNVLTDNVDSSGGTPDPDAIDCPAGGICTATFTLDANVTLTATVDPASSFTGWSDDCAALGPDLSGTLTLDADKTCTATFASPEMDVEGNNISIADGDVTPDPADHTDFENVDVGTSFERTFTIQNEGDVELSLHDFPAAVTLSGSADFSVVSQPASGSIPAGGDDLSFRVRCTPSDSGLRKTTVSIANNDPDENPYSFDLACTGVVPEIDVQGNGVSISTGDITPDAADGTDFGSVYLAGGSVEHTFTIENSGLGELTLTGSPRVEIIGAHASDFTVTQSPDTSVTGSGGTTTFGITFDPSGLGQRTAMVRIINNDGDENPYQFAVQGNGAELPEIDVLGNDQSIPAGDTTPDRGDLTDFGDVDESVGQVTHTFTIKNVGSDNLNLTGGTPLVSISGTGAADFSLATDATTPIAPGEEAIFQITFDPSVRTLRQAKVSIANDDQNENPYEFIIQGTGTDPAPEIEVQGSGVSIPDGDDNPASGDNTDFGDAALHATVQHTFVIRNTGSLELNLTTTPAIIIEGDQAADFSLTSDASTPVAASGGETSFEISFTPSAAGLREATVNIANDDSDESLYTFAIQGAGSGTPAMDVQGNAVSVVNGDMSPDRKDLTDFGSVAVDGGTVSHTLIIENSGTGDLSLTGTPRIAIHGDNASDFNVLAEPDSSVGSNNKDVFIIQFDPSGAGLRLATVSIANDSSENPYTFAIQGTGTTTGSGEEDADGGKPPNFKVCNPGGTFTHGPVKVLFPELTLSIYEVDGPSSLGDNIRLGEDGRVFDIIVRDYRGNLVSDFDFPIGVCIKPTAAELDAVGGNRHLLSVFHKHGGADWEVLGTFVDGEYVCATVNKLSLFGLGIPTLPETGFAPAVTVDLPEQPGEKAYFDLSAVTASEAWRSHRQGQDHFVVPSTPGDDKFVLEIPSLGIVLPIVGVPLTEDGWDVRWLGAQAGWLQGTAFPTWAGNTAITAHVWDTDNNPGPFVELDALQHGDEIIIRAWGLTHTYEVRAVEQVRPNDLRALPHEDYDVLTLLTCRGFDEASNQYDWRLAVRAVLIDVEAE